MGVKIPDSLGGRFKSSTSRRSRGKSKGSGCLIFLLIMIGLPLISIRSCSKKVVSQAAGPNITATSPVSEDYSSEYQVGSDESQPIVSESGQTDSFEEDLYEIQEEIPAPAEAPVEEASTVATESIPAQDAPETVASHVQNQNALEAIESRVNSYAGEAEYYRSQKSHKDKKGIYSLEGPLVDTANVFSHDQYVELCSFLLALDDLYGVQIAVLTVDNMDGESIEEFSMKHAEQWRLGQKGVDNGVLFVLSRSDRYVRIETGYGAEGALTDAYCSRIINKVMIPQFRTGHFAEGLTNGVKNAAGIVLSDDSLVTLDLTGEDESSSEGKLDGAGILILVIIVIFMIILSFRFPLFGAVVSEVMSGVFSGGSGGGFSGGGGGFGGGGASGHW